MGDLYAGLPPPRSAISLPSTPSYTEDNLPFDLMSQPDDPNPTEPAVEAAESAPQENLPALEDGVLDFDTWAELLKGGKDDDKEDPTKAMNDLLKGLTKSGAAEPLAKILSSANLGAKPIQTSVSEVEAKIVHAAFEPQHLFMKETLAHLHQINALPDLHMKLGLEACGKPAREIRIMAFLRDRFGLGLTLFPGFLKALLDSGSLSAVRNASMSTKAFQALGFSVSDLDEQKVKASLCADIQWVRRNASIVSLVVADAALQLKGTGQGKELELRDIQGCKVFVKDSTLTASWFDVLDGVVDLPGGPTNPRNLGHLLQNSILLSGLILIPFGKPLLEDAPTGDMVLLPPLVAHLLNEVLVVLPHKESYQRLRLALQVATHRESRIRLCKELKIAVEIDPYDLFEDHLAQVVTRLATSRGAQAASLKEHLLMLLEVGRAATLVSQASRGADVPPRTLITAIGLSQCLPLESLLAGCIEGSAECQQALGYVVSRLVCADIYAAGATLAPFKSLVNGIVDEATKFRTDKGWPWPSLYGVLRQLTKLICTPARAEWMPQALNL